MRLARAAVLAAACASLLATHAAAGLSCLPRFNQYFDVVEASQQQGKMVMVGSCSDEVGGQLVFVSADHGHTWKAAPQFTVPNLMMLTSVAYSPDANVFVAVGGVASTIYSSDGVNWAASQNGVRNYFFNGVRYLGGNFLAGASFGTVLASADGVNWRNLTGVRAVMRQEVESFALGSQVLVAVGGEARTRARGRLWRALTGWGAARAQASTTARDPLCTRRTRVSKRGTPRPCPTCSAACTCAT
jgi:hypothetical protein